MITAVKTIMNSKIILLEKINQSFLKKSMLLNKNSWKIVVEIIFKIKI